MKRRWVVLALPLVAALALTAWTGCKGGTPDAADASVAAAAAPAGPPPVIACDQPTHEFGSVSDGDEVKHTFVMKNTGQGALKITRAQGG